MASVDRRSAYRDERGAIMVCGLFFCVLGVSLVYYVWSIAEVIRYRERVQDAADMAAFSGAVVHAHGMNLLALLNMVMAALLAILVALRLVQLLCWFAIGTILAIGWLTGGALYSAVPVLQTTARTAKNTAETLETPIHKAIEGLHTLGEVVANITPASAALRAATLSTSSAFDPGVKLAAPIPLKLSLPVENDEFEVLCEHAGEYAGTMAMYPFELIFPSGGKVSDAVSHALGKLTKAGSGWFCGEEGASPPGLSQDSTHKTSLPASAARGRCLEPNREVPADGSTDPVCLEATVYELASLPDRRGRCREGLPACPASCQGDRCPPTGSDCYDDLYDDTMRRAAQEPVESCDAYHWRLEAARTQCKPRSEGGPKGLHGLWWLQQEALITYRYDGVDYRRVEEEPASDVELVRLGDGDASHPCGSRGTVGMGYAMTGAACESPGVCEGAVGSGPCHRPRTPEVGDTFTERVTQVTEVVHCVQEQKVPGEERKQQAEELDVRPEGEDSEKLAPFRLEEGVWLGDDTLQLRSFALGSGPREAPFRGVKLAAWGQDTGSFLDKVTKVVERFAVSQGEYYFHGEGAPLELGSEPDFLWKMRWRARLRPFHVGSGGLCGGGKWPSKLNKVSSTCKEVSGHLEDAQKQARGGR